MKNCLRALPVCLLVNDKGIESTFYKAPRPSARVLTLSHAPTPKHDIVWAREPLVQQIGAVGLFLCNYAEVSLKSCRSVVPPQRALAERATS